MICITIVSALFVLLFVLQETCHRAERRDLYDRLMCKGAGDYRKLREKKSRNAQPPYVVSAKKWRDTERRESE